MGKVTYFKTGDDFQFPSEFGFRGSTQGRHDAMNHPSMPDDNEYGDSGFKEGGYAKGGPTMRPHAPKGIPPAQVASALRGAAKLGAKVGAKVAPALNRMGPPPVGPAMAPMGAPPGATPPPPAPGGGALGLAEGGHVEGGETAHETAGRQYARGGDVAQPTVTGRKYLTSNKNDMISEPMQHGPSPSTTDVRDDEHLFRDVGKEYSDKGRVMGPPGDADFPEAELTGRTGTHYADGGDVAQDKALVRKGIRQHETQEHGGKHSKLELANGGKFIQGMHLKKGALHRDLGVPEGQPIPEAKLRAAASRSGKVGKRARTAEMLKGLPHSGKKG